MSINWNYVIPAMAVSVAVTLFLRSIAFVVFSGGRTMPAWLERLGKNLPSAIMAILVVYCLKGVGADPAHSGAAQLIAVLVTAVSYKWKHSTFLSIFLGTACNMILLRIL